ncbi:MAG TPA: hypothetical protein VME01_09540, partial [Solirubrobacteraceae bacterium]|nr:hypothetical protein [Solirubrobacteraceae bacterium]
DVHLARLGIYSLWLLLLVAIGGLATREVREVPRWLWGVPVVMWVTVVLINAETPRFREPIDPFFVLLAAAALSAAYQRFGGRARWPATSTSLSGRPDSSADTEKSSV